ncbi:GNAT family N-acetyltransferase [Paenarthrobacter ureafaciens]|nr:MULTISPECIES: GNAT family protein [Paenarthrobacter]BCW85882.1 alanine acetyltransferase [Arthrobacter sp. NicSoilE8]MEC3854043.1 GNAT family protein [Paenarthrobacter ureafaciens]NWL25994.1 GNAT family N-acetyltransferase [Paenarthrobacter ureafaciens]QSZ52545.1 acetyltransferase [Paenarthrobacter ureafaciens]WOC60678.1 GNAT family protein [Paenarthrobacter sp. AT5]
MHLSRILDLNLQPAGAARLAIRPLALADAALLADAYTRNASHLAPWEPLREDLFFTVQGQRTSILGKLAQFESGTEVPWVILAGERVVGTVTLTGIVRGPFQNAHVGYWVDRTLTGQGVAGAALKAVLEMAGEGLGLHRVQAAVLGNNGPSRAVLKRAGFEEIGLARSYLKIAGRWQDHILYQRILP